MADSIRQQIITALDTRLKTITKAKGYGTDAGKNVFDWLDRDLADSELDAIVYRDPSNEIADETFNQTTNRLRLEIEARTKAAATTAAQIRKIVQDIYAALGTDEKFGQLAYQTLQVGETIDIQQQDKIMASATITLDVYYITQKWSY